MGMMTAKSLVTCLAAVTLVALEPSAGAQEARQQDAPAAVVTLAFVAPDGVHLQQKRRGEEWLELCAGTCTVDVPPEPEAEYAAVYGGTNLPLDVRATSAPVLRRDVRLLPRRGDTLLILGWGGVTVGLGTIVAGAVVGLLDGVEFGKIDLVGGHCQDGGEKERSACSSRSTGSSHGDGSAAWGAVGVGLLILIPSVIVLVADQYAGRRPRLRLEPPSAARTRVSPGGASVSALPAFRSAWLTKDSICVPLLSGTW